MLTPVAAPDAAPQQGESLVRRSLTGMVAAAVLVSAAWIAAAPAFATTIHVDCNHTGLQPKIDHAAADSTLLLTGTCAGVFTIGKNLTLKGNPTATLDGQGLGSTVTINGAQLVQMTSLTVTGGLAAKGGGIEQVLGKLVLRQVTVSGNQAGGDTAVEGGGIHSTGTLSIVDSKILDNAAFAGDSVKVVAGGAGIFAEGPLELTNTEVSGNLATATSSAGDASAVAAGVAAVGSPVSIELSTIDGNRATSSAAQESVAEGGGLVAEDNTGQVQIGHTTISGNVATAHSDKGAVAQAGGAFLQEGTIAVGSTQVLGNRIHAVGSTSGAGLAGGMFVSGHATIGGSHVDGNVITATSGATTLGGAGGLVVGNGPFVLANSTVSRNSVSVFGVTGVFAEGGGLNASSGPVHLNRTTFDHDRIVASTSGGPTIVQGGAILVDAVFTMTNSTVSHAFLRGSIAGANDIKVQGGGIALTKANSKATIQNSTISNDTAVALSDPASGTSEAQGGGIYSHTGTVHLVESSVAGNAVKGSGHVNNPRGGGLFTDAGTVTVTDSILASNNAPTTSAGQNCSGTVGSGGHNVFGNLLGCTFSAATGDVGNADPKLGPLAPNGGPTTTRALLPGSPAIDHVPTAACPIKVDQRGTHRPQGPACDAGAFEKT